MGNPLEKDIFGYGLEDLELYDGFFYGLGISWNAPADLRNRILAAMISYTLGNKSVDYTLKTFNGFPNSKCEQNQIFQLLYEVTAIIKYEIQDELQRNLELDNEQDVTGYYVAKAALFRLWNTFITTVYTIRNAYHFG